MRRGPRANTDEVHDRLRADVLAGVYQPGERLRFAALGTTYGASVGVLREALMRLTEQGLVHAEARIGFSVAPLTEEDLDDLTFVRSEIETIALHHSIARGDVAWEAQLVAAHHTLARTPILTTEGPVRVSDEWETAHVAFHRALIAACGSPRLLSAAETLRRSSELYRRWSQPLDRTRDVPGEHDAIFAAAVARDADTAVALLRAHYARTADVLRAHMPRRDGGPTDPAEPAPRTRRHRSTPA